MCAKEKILLFIPAYRCEAQIGRVLAQISPDIASEFAEVLVVENRSPDGTLQAAQAGLEQIEGCITTLLQNDHNYSLGGSHKVAFSYCLTKGYDFVVVLHGDDQGSVTDLLPHVRSGLHRQFDCLLGSRFMRGSRLQGYSAFRTAGNYVFNTLVSLAARCTIHDLGSGLNMYAAEFLRSRFYMKFPDNLTFNVFMLYYSAMIKARMHFFPLCWREDDQLSNAKVFRQAWIIFQLTVSYMRGPQRLFDALPSTGLEYTSTTIYQRCHEAAV